jgi:hypothetical protein
MSTITTIANTDSPSSSIGIINTNFSNLNSDKIEATQTVALTNKTIDGDLNTLQDIPYSAIKSTSRSGLDVTLITGTEGTSGNLAKWNADGDLIDAGVATETSLTSSDTKSPTSKAVKDYVDAKIGTKSVFIPIGTAYSTVALNKVGNYTTRTLQNGESAYFTFQVPVDYVSGAALTLVMIPDSTESIQWDITAFQANSGQTYSDVTAVDNNVQLNVTANKMTFANISSTNMVTFLNGLSALDVVSILISSDITSIFPVGLTFEYSN